MSVPPHRIRRLRLEVALADQSSSWSVQTELARIHGQSLEAIIDSCCSAASDPRRIHRIESLEIDLGAVRLEHLEADLIAKLGPQLSKALAANIREEATLTAMAGAHPDTAASVELVAFFAQTGNLPWWVDAAPPRVVDETVGRLLQRAPRPLIALVRNLAESPSELRRLVIHCADARLAELFTSLLGTWSSARTPKSAEVELLLRAGSAGSGTTSYRSALWQAGLQVASGVDGASATPLRFWQAVLTQTALDIGLTYAVLVTRLGKAFRAPTVTSGVIGEALRSLLEEHKDRGSVEAAQRPPAERIFNQLRQSGTTHPELFAELRAAVHKLSGDERQRFLATLSTELRQALSSPSRGLREPSEISPPLAPLVDAPSPTLSRTQERNRAPLLQSSTDQEVPSSTASSDADPETSGEWQADGPTPLTFHAQELETVAAQLEQSEIAPKILFTELRAAIQKLAAEEDRRNLPSPALSPELRQLVTALLEDLHTLTQHAHLPRSGALAFTTGELLLRILRGVLALRWLPPRVIAQSIEALRQSITDVDGLSRTTPLPLAGEAGWGRGEQSLPPPSVLDLSPTPPPPQAGEVSVPSAHQNHWGEVLADPDANSAPSAAPERSAQPPVRTLLRGLEELKVSALSNAPLPNRQETPAVPQTARPPARVKPPRLNLAFSDTNEVYVENAGLVLLWPFLGSLFARLELTEDKQFKDIAALHRAIGLLGYLATDDPQPPEYQLMLAKVLCGGEKIDEFDFGLPVSETETEECAGLLTAVIANAPILREMSIEGFRGSFLLRKGVLSVVGGMWLLRVERVSYDVVLDQFPWGRSIVKLPWMESALSVEW